MVNGTEHESLVLVDDFAFLRDFEPLIFHGFIRCDSIISNFPHCFIRSFGMCESLFLLIFDLSLLPLIHSASISVEKYIQFLHIFLQYHTAFPHRLLILGRIHLWLLHLACFLRRAEWFDSKWRIKTLHQNLSEVWNHHYLV